MILLCRLYLWVYLLYACEIRLWKIMQKGDVLSLREGPGYFSFMQYQAVRALPQAGIAFCDEMQMQVEWQMKYIFSKAFVSVFYSVVILKLRKYGLDSGLLGGLKTGWTTRLWRGVTNGSTSVWWQSPSGVPQGLILSLYCLISSSTTWTMTQSVCLQQIYNGTKLGVLADTTKW